MKSGNEIDHLAAQALRTGSAKELWARLRHGYFNTGTQEQAMEAMKQRFAAMGVTTSVEFLGTEPDVEAWVFLSPASGQGSAQR